MKVLILLQIAFVVLFYSCNKQNVKLDISAANESKLISNTIHSISSDVKMVYIPGGEYNHFMVQNMYLQKLLHF